MAEQLVINRYREEEEDTSLNWPRIIGIAFVIALHAAALLALLMLVALPLWAAEPRDLAWSEMIPPDAPTEVPNMKPLHDLSQMSDALAAESAPAAKQDLPNAPVVQSLDGQAIRLSIPAAHLRMYR